MFLNKVFSTELYSHHDTTHYLDIDVGYIERSDNRFSFNISVEFFSKPLIRLSYSFGGTGDLGGKGDFRLYFLHPLKSLLVFLVNSSGKSSLGALSFFFTTTKVHKLLVLILYNIIMITLLLI